MRPRAGFEPLRLGPRLLAGIGAIAIVGALLLGISIARPNHVPQAISNPHAVLVAITGENGQPGFAGFLAIINPNSRNLSVVPIPGTLMAGPGHTPLWVTANGTSPRQVTAAISRQIHQPITGYFVLDYQATEAVLNELDKGSPDWPKKLTPANTLALLGWPDGTPSQHGQFQALQAIITFLPELPSNQTNLFHLVLQGSKTNLSIYQMFMLATYIRGDNLVLVPLSRLSRAGRRHQP